MDRENRGTKICVDINLIYRYYIHKQYKVGEWMWVGVAVDVMIPYQLLCPRYSNPACVCII